MFEAVGQIDAAQKPDAIVDHHELLVLGSAERMLVIQRVAQPRMREPVEPRARCPLAIGGKNQR